MKIGVERRNSTMFREMRRKKQLLTEAESENLLKEGSSGVLALLGDGGYPYAVPLSYVYENSKLYFHGAKAGHKVDAIRNCNKASFCVISQDTVVPEEYTTYYKSVIVFGEIRVLEREEALKAIRQLADKYHPAGSEAEREKEISDFQSSLCMLELSVEHMTGKRAKEL